jgi:purine nucleosidase
MEKIILDCDPGHDDAIAILLAAGNPNIDLLGITTVSGNHNVENTTRNALSVCTAYGIKVPVAKGSPGPLLIDQVLAVEIHGDTGLDGPELPPASFDLDKRHAVDFIIDTVMAHEPKTVTLVPVGPYTNIALAVRKDPRIVERVKRVVTMGGSYTRGKCCSYLDLCCSFPNYLQLFIHQICPTASKGCRALDSRSPPCDPRH